MLEKPVLFDVTELQCILFGRHLNSKLEKPVLFDVTERKDFAHSTSSVRAVGKAGFI